MKTTPVLPAPPFDAPPILSARRMTGGVLASENLPKIGSDPLELVAGIVDDSDDSQQQSKTNHNFIPANILLVQSSDSSQRAYWLQRKISHTTNGSVRVGFALQPAGQNISYEGGDDSDGWLVQASTDSTVPYLFEMVAIKVQDRDKVEGFYDPSRPRNGNRDPTVELSAMHWIHSHNSSANAHVVGTSEICVDNNQIYAIVPYHGEGSLFQYVLECGRLGESVARYFFQQIVQGLSTLKEAGVCHRDLSLQNVLIRGRDCSIVGLGLAMRVPSDDDGMSALLEPQPLSGADLQYLAPEILQNQPFDGYAVDLWAAGIMLCIMLFGAKTPFMWASPTDKTFREISLNGNLKGAVGRWLQRTAAEEAGEGGVELQYPLVSEDALDLIQGMLRAKPSDRFRLDQVKEHPWMAGRSTPPAVPTPSHHHHTPVGR